MKKISGILIILIFLGLVLTAGCSQSRQSSGLNVPSLSLKPAPTTNAQFQIHEPATDGNLSVTVLNVSVIRSGIGQKSFYVQVKLVNLHSDKEIQVSPQDFALTTTDGAVYNATSLYSQRYDLKPDQRESPELEFRVPLNAVSSQLKFDFSGPNGILNGGKVVYFNL